LSGSTIIVVALILFVLYDAMEKRKLTSPATATAPAAPPQVTYAPVVLPQGTAGLIASAGASQANASQLSSQLNGEGNPSPASYDGDSAGGESYGGINLPAPKPQKTTPRPPPPIPPGNYNPMGLPEDASDNIYAYEQSDDGQQTSYFNG
jgi:hypothetical protein